MNESKKRFVEQLLAADPPSPDARGRYEKEVRAMLEKTISPRQRRLYLIAAVVSGLPLVTKPMLTRLKLARSPHWR